MSVCLSNWCLFQANAQTIEVLKFYAKISIWKYERNSCTTTIVSLSLSLFVFIKWCAALLSYGIRKCSPSVRLSYNEILIHKIHVCMCACDSCRCETFDDEWTWKEQKQEFATAIKKIKKNMFLVQMFSMSFNSWDSLNRSWDML